MSAGTVTLTPQTHRFFHQLATAQAATVSYIVSTIARTGGDIAVPLGGPISQVCFTRPEEVQFNPIEVLDPISKNYAWPEEIHLTFQYGGGPPPVNQNPNSVQLLMGSLYEHAFITYLAKNEAAIRATHGGNKHWPDVLKFGRIVRNAFAHGGTLNITDGISGSWGGISYSEAKNSRRVLYNDLSAGDLTVLMLEMDAQF